MKSQYSPKIEGIVVQVMERNEGLNKDRTAKRVVNAVIGLVIEDLAEMTSLPSKTKPRARDPMVSDSDSPKVVSNTHRLNMFRRSRVNLLDVQSKEMAFIVLKVNPQSFGNKRGEVILRQGRGLVFGDDFLFEKPRFKRSRARQSRSISIQPSMPIK
jgi:hypothetical protein